MMMQHWRDRARGGERWPTTPDWSEMQIRLSPQLAEKVRSLMGVHHYDAEELISIGLAIVEVVLREKYQDGNDITIVTPDGQIAGEFQLPLPNKINNTARMYLESIFTNESPL